MTPSEFVSSTGQFFDVSSWILKGIGDLPLGANILRREQVDAQLRLGHARPSCRAAGGGSFGP